MIEPDDSPGIFDPKIAKEKELKIFKIIQQNFIDHVGVALASPNEDELADGKMPSIEEDPELADFKKKINTWRSELVGLYGEEVLSS